FDPLSSTFRTLFSAAPSAIVAPVALHDALPIFGIARAVIVVMEDGRIMDTIVHGALIPLESMHVALGAQSLYIFNLLFNLLVTSGTGQASIVMPLLVPLVDMLYIMRQTGVLAW